MFNQSLALLTLGQITARRVTFGQLREATGVKRGLSFELEELRASGKVHYELDASGQVDDNTVISLCTAIELERGYRLIVLAPDEASPTDGQPVWQILIHGTSNPVLASEGFRYYASAGLSAISYSLETLLYNNVSSSVVGNTLERVLAVLEILYKEYARRRATGQ